MAADAGYVLVIPIGGIIFHAAGRPRWRGSPWPLLGFPAASAANFLPSGVMPCCRASPSRVAQLLDPGYMVNTPVQHHLRRCLLPADHLRGLVCHRAGGGAASQAGALNEDLASADEMGRYSARESRAFQLGRLRHAGGRGAAGAGSVAGRLAAAGADGSLTTFAAPVMKSIAPHLPALYPAWHRLRLRGGGSFGSGKDVIDAMSATMNKMGSYMVMAFFCALFIKAFGDSNLGTLLALSGAEVLHALALPGEVTIVGMILLTATVNLVGARPPPRALISPHSGAHADGGGDPAGADPGRVSGGDSASNIITPLMVFPLVVAP